MDIYKAIFPWLTDINKEIAALLSLARIPDNEQTRDAFFKAFRFEDGLYEQYYIQPPPVPRDQRRSIASAAHRLEEMLRETWPNPPPGSIKRMSRDLQELQAWARNPRTRGKPRLEEKHVFVEAALDLCRKHAPKPPSSSARNYFRQFAAQFYYIATGKRSELDHQIRRALQKSDRRV